MTQEFKKAVDTNKTAETPTLAQPEKFMNGKKVWADFDQAIKHEQELPTAKGQVVMSMAVEPSMREAIQLAGKNKGRRHGGVKAVVREALSEYLAKHPELLD